ncbi:MAG TPA: VOC family protein [Variovorax sp.]|nr:VOC family protein [Variovorax sp.]
MTHTLSDVHHLRLPVSDLARSLRWYTELFGFEPDFPFRREGEIFGWALKQALGRVKLTLIQDPEQAAKSAGFPYFSLTVPDEASLRRLAATLDERGIAHADIAPGLVGFKLLDVCDPDGHRIGFYMSGERTRLPG